MVDPSGSFSVQCAGCFIIVQACNCRFQKAQACFAQGSQAWRVQRRRELSDMRRASADCQPDRWLPYKQRASTAAALAAASGAGKKKKGGKEGMGTGMTQGSVNDAPSTSQGGGNKKKGKKGR